MLAYSAVNQLNIENYLWCDYWQIEITANVSYTSIIS